MSYRFYPLPRPSLKSERSSRSPYKCSSCNSPCNGDVCNGCSDPTRNPAAYSEGGSFIPQPPSPHVHFLGLCQTYLVDYEYDRTSTVVMPNECALPARGCPGKTYFSTQVANAARTGRRLARCATPGASRANSRSRNNMSPPPSPSLYAKHIFYPDEYPFPSPIPSPRAMPAPPLVADTGMTPHASDDSDQGLSTPPESASQTPSPPSLSRRGSSNPAQLHSGSQLFIDAPGHPPIPGLMSPMSRSMGDMFAITNALNGLDMHGMGNGGGSGCGSATSPMDGPWMIPGRRASQSAGSPESRPKKVKSKKSKSSLTSSPGETKGASKKARIAPSSGSCWRSDTGALGGF